MNPSIQRLAQLMQARREHEEPPYVLLLGSSLSITPAVRRASAGTEEWEAFWKEMQRASSTERKALLKKPLDALGLEPGYQAMARLAEVGYFNLILTLNVDDAIDDAMSPLPAEQRELLIYDGSNATQIVAALSRLMPRIKVVKLRGDINAQALPLTDTGTFEFPDNLKRSISEWLKHDTILVGDVPYDTDVQRCITRSDGALWCILPDEPASDSFIKHVKRARLPGEIITGAYADFNEFFKALAVALKVEPTPSVVRQPRRVDAALPSQAQVGQSIDLVIAVKLSGSPKLDAREIRGAGISRGFPDDAKVEPKPVEVKFPVDERTGRLGSATLEIQVIAPEFRVHGPERKRLLVPLDRDSELCKFPLTPRTHGDLEVTVELYNSQGAHVGTMSLETKVRSGSVLIDRRLVMIWRVVTLPVVLIIAPSGGIALAASQLPPAAPDGRYQIHLEDRTEGVVIGDAAQVTQHFDVHPAREDVGRLSAVEERAALERELALHRRTLFRLREQLAIFPVGDQPVHLLTQVEDEEQKIVNIEAKLQQLNEAIRAEAQRQRQLAELYSQGMGCFQGGDWAQAIHFFEQILDVDRDYNDTSQRLIQAEKQERLEQLYARIKQAKANQHWQQMIRVCQEIIGIAPFYRDVQRLLRKARFHSARQRAVVVWAHYGTRIIILAILLLMAVGIPVLGGWIMSVWPSTSTPSTLRDSKEVVIEINGVRIDASDDRCREIVCNSSPRIQVTVMDSTGVPLQPDIFSYNWCFDPSDSRNLDRLDSKNYAIIYSVPCDLNNQTVTIEVLENGETLSVRGACFNIKKQP